MSHPEARFAPALWLVRDPATVYRLRSPERTALYRLLVANHDDEADGGGTGLTKLPGPDPIDRRRSGLGYLVSAEVLDEKVRRHGLLPSRPRRRSAARPTRAECG